MKKIFISLMLMAAAFSCTEDDKTPTKESYPPDELGLIAEDGLSDERVEELDAIPSEEINVSDIILPNGMNIADFNDELSSGRTRTENEGPQQIKNKIIKKMLEDATFLTNRTNHQKPDEGTDRPAQNGLAYAIGNKNYAVREKPNSTRGQGFEGITTDYVYGLDCSGFVAASVKDVLHGGIPTGNVAKQADTAVWNKAIRAAFPSDCSRVKMVDQGHLDFDELMTGDIIYWLEGGDSHIGMIADLPGPTRFLINSNGSTGTTCYKKDAKGNILVDNNKNPLIDEVCLKEQTEKNRSLKRGPRMMSFHEAVTTSGFWGNDYKVLRLTTEINGNWNVGVRCVGQTTNAIEANLSISSDNEMDDEIPVEATGTGTDYTGDPIVFTIRATYYSITNVLKGSIVMSFPNNPGDGREDAFEVKLLKDDTGYFAATKVVVNGGCNVEFRLLNNGCDADSGNGRVSHLKVVSSGNGTVSSLR